MVYMDAKKNSYFVVVAAWLAVFCLFGYRSTFAILAGPMSQTMGWTGAQVSLGYSLMMSIYAITAFFSGMILDKWGTKPVYTIAAVFCMLGFYLTAKVESLYSYYAAYAIFAGIGTGMLWVSSTISIRKWFVGKYYAKMWGIAFAGAPMAQIVLSLGVKPMLVENAGQWRDAMTILGWISLVALLLAALLAKKNPEQYGLHAFGEVPPAKGTAAQQEYPWKIGEAFSTFPIWGSILAFLTSMVGIAGIFTMPLLGIVSDKLVVAMKNEIKARKTMLIFGPAVGAVACLLLMTMGPQSTTLGALICVLFAVYWAIEPGGVVGYAGAIYGRVSLGKLWGLATLIVMGIGPALGSFMGGYLADTTGNFIASIKFALCSFVLSAIIAFILPLKIKVPDQQGVVLEENEDYTE